MEPGKRLAFDFGSVRIGVAVSDNFGIIATPLEFLPNDEKLRTRISNLLAEFGPKFIIVGIPKHLSGQMGATAVAIEEFVSVLKSLTHLKIYGVDERLSTVSAAAKLRENGVDSKSAKELIDSAAAVSILELALQIEANGGLEKCEL